jgi:hypothetical protein
VLFRPCPSALVLANVKSTLIMDRLILIVNASLVSRRLQPLALPSLYESVSFGSTANWFIRIQNFITRLYEQKQVRSYVHHVSVVDLWDCEEVLPVQTLKLFPNLRSLTLSPPPTALCLSNNKHLATLSLRFNNCDWRESSEYLRFSTGILTSRLCVRSQSGRSLLAIYLKLHASLF